jgi:hypothetical protein
LAQRSDTRMAHDPSQNVSPLTPAPASDGLEQHSGLRYARKILRADPHRLPINLLKPFDAEMMTAWNVDRNVANAA